MTNDKGILILNIYYMLSYAFQELRKNNYEDIDKEEFDQILDLFAEILFRGVSAQLKQGLCREYMNRREVLPVMKGRLDINGTIRARIQRQCTLSCEYDELSENNIFNRILKGTMLRLLHCSDIQRKRKVQLRRIMPFFSDIDDIDLDAIKWNTLRFQRNNRSYRMLMNICYFIVDSTLMTTERGAHRMPTFSDEHMNKLFERFVLNYYKREFPEYRPNADEIKWNIEEDQSVGLDFLPCMHSDITLHNGPSTLIIDTKYYGRMMQQSQYDKRSFHSANLYQIFTYVKNCDTAHSGQVTGMLLYAKAGEEDMPILDTNIGGNRIMVRVLDLNRKFDDIKIQLNNLVYDVFGKPAIGCSSD